MSEKQQCSVRVFDGSRMNFQGYMCHKPAKVQADGKWYCATHDPEAVKRRNAKQEEKWEAQRKADHERWDRQAYNTKAGDACRALGIVDPETELPKLVRREDF